MEDRKPNELTEEALDEASGGKLPREGHVPRIPTIELQSAEAKTEFFANHEKDTEGLGIKDMPAAR